MNFHIKELMQRLIYLQMQAQKIDEALKDVRVEINNIFWNLKESKEYKKTNDGY